MKRKLIFNLILCLGLSSVFCACSKDDDVSNGTGSGTELEEQARPTDWVAVSQGVDLQSTMIADVTVDLTSLGLTYEGNEQDLMAAFIDGTCRSVSSPVMDEGKPMNLFALTIKKLEKDAPNAPITLKFYSAKLRHTFTIASPFPYMAEGSYGSVQTPEKPVWTR